MKSKFRLKVKKIIKYKPNKLYPDEDSMTIAERPVIQMRILGLFWIDVVTCNDTTFFDSMIHALNIINKLLNYEKQI